MQIMISMYNNESKLLRDERYCLARDLQSFLKVHQREIFGLEFLLHHMQLIWVDDLLTERKFIFCNL
jgi:hypothetical protein